MATTAELITACKIGMNISVSSTAFDLLLAQKIGVVKGYLLNGGLTSGTLDSDEAIGAVVIGVGDVWNLSSGEAKFSDLFWSLAAQLAGDSALLKISSSYPEDGDTDIPASAIPVVTFSKQVERYEVKLMEYVSKTDVRTYIELDITEKTVTVTPLAELSASLKYALIVTAKAIDGVSLGRTVISFTTA